MSIIALGAFARRRRKQLGMSCEGVARVVGCSVSTVRNLEYGRGSTVRTLLGVAKALDVSASTMARIAARGE